MSAPLNQLLEHVLEGEPPIGDEVDAVFHRADTLRRRRGRAVLAVGGATAAVIVVLGYVLTTTLLEPAPLTLTPTALPGTAGVAAPTAPPLRSAHPVPVPSIPDRVLDLIEPLVESRQLQIVPVTLQRGNGWRRYQIIDEQGRSRGTIGVAVYDVREKWCFPVAADDEACARPDRADGLEFVRYDDMSDPDRQVRQTIARRLDDDRTVTVVAAGERGKGAQRGKPGLTGAQVEQVATDEDLFAAFGKKEDCRNGCPDFPTPVEK